MTTLVVNGNGSKFRVTTTEGKTPKVLMVTKGQVKTVTVSKPIEIKFAA